MANNFPLHHCRLSLQGQQLHGLDLKVLLEQGIQESLHISTFYHDWQMGRDHRQLVRFFLSRFRIWGYAPKIEGELYKRGGSSGSGVPSITIALD